MTEASPPKLTPPPKGSELLRQNLFEERASEDEGELLKRREPTMLRKGRKLIAPSCGTSKKYTVVFDLDETVVYARDGPLYGRAYLKDLFRAIKDDFEVIVWTAGERDYAKCILEEINDDHIIEHLVYRHKKWFNEEDYTKDLRQLGRDLNYTIMIENTPDCVRANPQNGIIVEDFEVLPETTEEEGSMPPTPVPTPPPQRAQSSPNTESTATTAGEDTGNAAPRTPTTEGQSTETFAPPAGPSGGREETVAGKDERAGASSPSRRRRATDRTLFLLREVLASLAKSGQTVPAFLASCELLSQQTVVGSDGNDIPIYHLGTRRRRKDAGSPRKVVKANRDKAPPCAVSEEAVPATTAEKALTSCAAPDRSGNRDPEAHSSEPKARRPKPESPAPERPLFPSAPADSANRE